MATASLIPGDPSSERLAVVVAVVYHSGFGHTRVQAEAVCRGIASVDGATARLVSVDDVDDHWDVLDAADAIIFGTPTYMAGPSAAFKTFLDDTSGRWQEQRWIDKLAAGFTNSAGLNGDKLATLQALSLFAMQHGMVWIGLGLLPGNHTSNGSPEDLNRLAGFLGAMAQSHADQPADIAPPAADQRTAEHLGVRVALAALRWRPVRLARSGGGMNGAIVAIAEVLTTYVDGLHHSDTDRLRRVFHPAASYVTATDEPLVVWSMEEYFQVVDGRPSPASKGESRVDRIVSIELAGPVTAMARVECRIAPKSFTDILTLVHVDGRWQIISKVFHFDLDQEPPCPT